MEYNFDFLVVGGGVAGLTYALRAARRGTVAVLFKKSENECATSQAQGGIAAVHSLEDSLDLHLQDTLTAGAGLCNREIAELVISEGPERIAELVAIGVGFDRSPGGRGFDLHREGGHSTRRIFHYADATGQEVQRALLEAAKAQDSVSLFTYASAIDLITTRKLAGSAAPKNTAIGAYVLMPDRSVAVFKARKILVSTGGAGKVYLYTSNPDLATGDGIAMCFRAGAAVANMEFFQFHPTCLYHPRAKSFLITEAMRGEGAVLRRIDGEPFMQRYHEKKELAPRDIVARAIDHEMKSRGEDFVLLDITHRGSAFIKDHFPTIFERCLSFGIDITREPIPVVPAAHYCCGGVVTDKYGRTALENLYAAGECAHSGLHGANRLASNSLLEGLVFGARAAEHSVQAPEQDPWKRAVPGWDAGTAVDSDEAVVISHNWDEIRRLMWNYVGIVRSDKRLARALRRSDMIQHEIQEYYWNFTLTPDLLELRNLSLVASLVIRSAILRKESRGLHYNVDYPRIDDSFLRDTVLEPEKQ